MIRIWVFFSLLFLFLPVPEITAHPHIFIVQRLNVAFDDKGLSGIKVCWHFDDMFAAMVIEEHDVNRNGKFEENEIQTIKEKAFSYIAEYSYFTFIKIDGIPFDVKFIKDFNAVLMNRKLIYEFFIPCHVTASQHAKKITIASYDPSYYTAILFSEKAPVGLTAAEGL